MAKRVLGVLPADGSTLRAEDVFERCARLGIARTTVLRHLREAHDRLLVSRVVTVERGRSAVSYGLSEDLLPFSQDGLLAAVGEWDEWPMFWSRAFPNETTKNNLRDWLEGQFADLLTAMYLSLVKAAKAESRSIARTKAEAAVDLIYRRWIASLAEALWARRDLAEEALFDAFESYKDVAQQVNAKAKAALEEEDRREKKARGS